MPDPALSISRFISSASYFLSINYAKSLVMDDLALVMNCYCAGCARTVRPSVFSRHCSSHVKEERLVLLATIFVGSLVTAIDTGRGGVVQPVSGFSASESFESG